MVNILQHSAGAVRCDPALSSQLEWAARTAAREIAGGFTQTQAPVMMSGAGHDAMAMSHLTKVLLLHFPPRPSIHPPPSSLPPPSSIYPPPRKPSGLEGLTADCGRRPGGDAVRPVPRRSEPLAGGVCARGGRLGRWLGHHELPRIPVSLAIPSSVRSGNIYMYDFISCIAVNSCAMNKSSDCFHSFQGPLLSLTALCPV